MSHSDLWLETEVPSDAVLNLLKASPTFSTTARLAELNLYPLESRRIRGDLMLLFHLFQTGDVHDFFTLTAQKHLRGHPTRN